MSSLQVVCDNCGTEIDSRNITILERTHTNELINTYFECPCCNKRFHILYHNKKTNKLQEEINNCSEKTKLKKLKIKLKNELDRINNRN